VEQLHIDRLEREGRITERQASTWGQPKFVSHKQKENNHENPRTTRLRSATCNRNRCIIPDNRERPGKNSQRLPAGPGSAEQQSIHPLTLSSPLLRPHHSLSLCRSTPPPRPTLLYVDCGEPPGISPSPSTAINRGACKSNSPIRSLTTGWGSGAINLPRRRSPIYHSTALLND
jgi:hypothetical protein